MRSIEIGADASTKASALVLASNLIVERRLAMNSTVSREVVTVLQEDNTARAEIFRQKEEIF